jgi:hypothetical protein
MSRVRSPGFWSVVLIVALLVVLRPMACAGPIDPSWIAGYYDDGDFDDVANLIATTSAVTGALPTIPWVLPRAPEVTAERRAEPPRVVPLPSLFTRAPPPPFAPPV